ncbi:hypothetical protein PMAYCL1PPCAC_27723, partial [Pristionchus mayeri]
QEMPFFFVSLCIFIAQFLNLIIMVLLTIYQFSPFESAQLGGFTFVIMNWTSTTFSIGPVYYTILLPGPIKRYYRSKLSNIRISFEFSSASNSREIRVS